MRTISGWRENHRLTPLLTAAAVRSWRPDNWLTILTSPRPRANALQATRLVTVLRYRFCASATWVGIPPRKDRSAKVTRHCNQQTNDTSSRQRGRLPWKMAKLAAVNIWPWTQDANGPSVATWLWFCEQNTSLCNCVRKFQLRVDAWNSVCSKWLSFNSIRPTVDICVCSSSGSQKFSCSSGGPKVSQPVSEMLFFYGLYFVSLQSAVAFISIICSPLQTNWNDLNNMDISLVSYTTR
jgi:hypothetical protein